MMIDDASENEANEPYSSRRKAAVMDEPDTDKDQQLINEQSPHGSDTAMIDDISGYIDPTDGSNQLVILSF